MVMVELDLASGKKIVEVKRISMKKYLEILKRCTKTQMKGEDVVTTLESSDYRWEMIKASVGDQIKEDELDMVNGLKLEQAITEVNSLETSFQGKISS
jgi:hypothetical protein